MRSEKKITINTEPIAQMTGWNPINKNKTAVIISTTGYCQEIGFLQYRHFPRKNIKESRGMLSAQDKI